MPTTNSDPGIVPALLTREQAAEFIGVSLRQTYRLQESNHLPKPITVGSARVLRWRRTDLEKWIERGCPQATRPRRKTNRRRA